MGVNLDKPKVGQPCNGCGLCCQIQVCRNGAYILGLVDELGGNSTRPLPCFNGIPGPAAMWCCAKA